MAQRKKSYSAFTKPQPMIKWNATDEQRLKIAVREFNDKIKQLAKNPNKKNYLPDSVSYKELREGIKSRSELNRKLNSLGRFMKKGASKIEVVNGTGITAWELHEARIEKSIAVRRYKEELAFLSSKQPKSKYYKKHSRVQMGSSRAKEIKAILKNMPQLSKLSGEGFFKAVARFHNIGTSDFLLRQNILYSQNYYKAMDIAFGRFKDYTYLKQLMQEKLPVNSMYNILMDYDEKLADIELKYNFKGQKEYFENKFKKDMLGAMKMTEEDFKEYKKKITQK